MGIICKRLEGSGAASAANYIQWQSSNLMQMQMLGSNTQIEHAIHAWMCDLQSLRSGLGLALALGSANLSFLRTSVILTRGVE